MLTHQRRTNQNQADRKSTGFDYRYGETDLVASGGSRGGSALFVLGATLFVTLLLGGAALFLLSSVANTELEPNPTAQQQGFTTNTNAPTLGMATVTQGPPTATYSPTPTITFTPSITPTREPCSQTIQQGGNLITAILNCGYTSQDVDIIPTVLALNDLPDANSIRAGQQIFIPWPTPTTDPNAIPTATPTVEGEAAATDAEGIVSVDESIQAFAATVTPTLPAGVMWHTVQPEENIITIAVAYSADVKTLSELNREIDFARCDFGERFGGPECIVQLFQGQRLRVPAPTPTPTLSPTIDPNSTATPTATATFNRPSPYSPADQSIFYVDELITLRWTPSATLNPGETYRVDVVDETSGITYTAYTEEIFFIIPREWQGTQQQRHEFTWRVSIVSADTPHAMRYQTEPQRFTWQGNVEDEQ